MDSIFRGNATKNKWHLDKLLILLILKKFLNARRNKSDYNSKNASHVFVAGFVLAVLVKKSYILSRDPFMLKKF